MPPIRISPPETDNTPPKTNNMPPYVNNVPQSQDIISHRVLPEGYVRSADVFLSFFLRILRPKCPFYFKEHNVYRMAA